MSIADKIYELKSKYGKIVKIPLNNPSFKVPCDLYCRTLKVGEWFEFRSDKSNPKIAPQLLKKIIIHVETSNNLQFDMDNLFSLGGICVNIIEKISAQSGFDNSNDLLTEYEQKICNCNSKIFILMQRIMLNYSSYKFKDVANMNSEELMTLCAMVDSTNNTPYFTEYIVEGEKYRKMFMEINQIPDNDEFELSYQDFIKVKKMEAGIEDGPISKKEQIFVTKEGKIVKGDKNEYIQKRNKIRDELKNKRTAMPDNIDDLSKIDSEGIDPNNIPSQQEGGDYLIKVSSETSKNKLKQRLEKEKQMKMQGINPSNKFNWDKEIDDMSWGE